MGAGLVDERRDGSVPFRFRQRVPATAPRRESKYRLRRRDVEPLRAALAASCERVVHRYATTTVRSIYFDDAALSAYRANLDGTSPRHKLRLRWYDADEPGASTYFEVKWRRNRTTGKDRYELDAVPGFSSTRYSTILTALAGALPPDAASLLAASGVPTLLVEYRREHFLSRVSDLRFTLDHDLRFVDQSARVRPQLGSVGAVALDDVAVLEAKLPGGAPSGRLELPIGMKLRATRFSKYAEGCRAVGLVPAVD